MMSKYINTLGAALPAEQKAAGAPLTRTGFIPTMSSTSSPPRISYSAAETGQC